MSGEKPGTKQTLSDVEEEETVLYSFYKKSVVEVSPTRERIYSSIKQ